MSRLRPPTNYSKPGTSGTNISAANQTTRTCEFKDSDKKNKTGKKIEFDLQPLSIPLKPPKKSEQINWEEIKKRTIRRNAPEGEDKKGLIRVMKSLRESNQRVDVYEFINLVSPFTGDNGAEFRSVLEDELANFRNLLKRIYETQTQDVSDVLVNEQMQMTAFYQHKMEMLQEKLSKMLNDIYTMAPGLKFEEFAIDREAHLNYVLPIPRAVAKKTEDIEMMKRQAAFHRTQWLKFEGERLAEENRRLQLRLNDLKRQQLIDQQAAADAVAEAEAKKQQLQAQEAEKLEALDTLNESIGKGMVRTEAFINRNTNIESRDAGTSASAAAAAEAAERARGHVKKKGGKRIIRPEWVSTTAEDLEQTAFSDRMNAEFAEADIRMARRTRHVPSLAPCGRGPSESERERSAFHYSPRRMQEPLPETPQVLQSTKVEHATTSIQDPRPGAKKSGATCQPDPTLPPPCSQKQLPPPPPPPQQQQQQRRGRCNAPKDTWGGFN